MKRTAKNRKLSLNRETIRALDLQGVSGGLFKSKLLCPKPNTQWGASCVPGACPTFLVDACQPLPEDN